MERDLTEVRKVRSPDVSGQHELWHQGTEVVIFLQDDEVHSCFFRGMNGLENPGYSRMVPASLVSRAQMYASALEEVEGHPDFRPHRTEASDGDRKVRLALGMYSDGKVRRGYEADEVFIYENPQAEEFGIDRVKDLQSVEYTGQERWVDASLLVAARRFLSAHDGMQQFIELVRNMTVQRRLKRPRVRRRSLR